MIRILIGIRTIQEAISHLMNIYEHLQSLKVFMFSKMGREQSAQCGVSGYCADWCFCLRLAWPHHSSDGEFSDFSACSQWLIPVSGSTFVQVSVTKDNHHFVTHIAEPRRSTQWTKKNTISGGRTDGYPLCCGFGKWLKYCLGCLLNGKFIVEENPESSY